MTVEDRQESDRPAVAAVAATTDRAATTPGGFAAPAFQRRSSATYAALDLGTNNCRLLIARPAQHGFRVVDAFSRIVRLGEGLSASGRLCEGAMERAVEALKICKSKMDHRGVTRARLITTEAVSYTHLTLPTKA